MRIREGEKNTVLVGVLKRKRDLDILLDEHWYHMPVLKSPRRAFRHLALYQPSLFGQDGKRIRYYGRVVRVFRRKRREIFPDEVAHPHANDEYERVHVDRVRKLPRPIRNVPPRRISFGFTTLACLRKARNILELYRVFPAEKIVELALKRAGIPATPQYRFGGKKRYQLDFAISCRRGSVAIECDNTKAHAGAAQRLRDKKKDAFLRRRGWVVIRLREPVIAGNIQSCIRLVKRAVNVLGGAIPNSKSARTEF